MMATFRFLAYAAAGFVAAGTLLFVAKQSICTALQGDGAGFWLGVRVFLGCWQ